jgi:hypothetical protein
MKAPPEVVWILDGGSKPALGTRNSLEELGRENRSALYRSHREWVERLARGAEAQTARPAG